MTLPLFALGLALLVANADPVVSPPPSATLAVEIEARGGRLTLRAQQVPLRLVLERIGELARIKMHVEGPAEEAITVDFQDVPLDDALRRLLRHRSVVLIYEAAAGPLVALRVVQSKSLTHSLSSEEPETLPADAAWGEPEQPGTLPSDLAQGEPNEPETPSSSAAALGEPIDPGADALAQASNAVDAVEDEVRGLPDSGSLNLSRFLDRLNDPEPSVRLTALHWLVTRPEARLPALASALKDSDAGVRTAAAQMIADHDVSEEAVREVMAAAETAEAERVVQLLYRLLPL